MNNWKKLTEAQNNKIWDWFYKEFLFNPSTNPENWPSIKTSKPSIKIDITNLWGDNYNETIWNDFLQKAIEAFINVTNFGEQIFALDWHHECFYIDPRELTPEMLTDDESSNTVISFIPDGDYYIFITKDFENVWFGHPWENNVTIIGSRLINAFNNNPPLLVLKSKT
jgi:hypothetical protein